jgi:Cu(I)/Ag(I) efflux system membrane fusion protein
MRRVFLVAVIFIIAGSIGYGIGRARNQTLPLVPLIAAAKGPAHKVYVCPMHQQIVQDHPGTCPICGMDLVEGDASGHSDHGDTAQIHVDTATMQKLGVTLAKVRTQQLGRTIHTYGTVASDDAASFVVTPTVPGVLTKLTANHVGQRLAAGQLLYEIESDVLLQLQHDYVDFLIRKSQTLQNAELQRERNRKLAQQMKGMDAAERQQAERNLSQSEEQIRAMLQPMERDGIRLSTRLQYAGLTDGMLAEISKTSLGRRTVPVRLQRPCLVKEIGARPGMTMAASTPIVTCAEDGRLWLEVALYPDQAALAHLGDEVSVRGEDGASINARLTQLSGVVDPATRTVRVRVPVEGRDLRIGDYLDVTIRTAPHQVLAIPRSALIRTGHGDFVILARGNGHFLPSQVKVGIEGDDDVEIKAGLQVGAAVAVNGNFLLDSAASLSATVQRMSGSGSGSGK